MCAGSAIDPVLPADFLAKSTCELKRFVSRIVNPFLRAYIYDKSVTVAESAEIVWDMASNLLAVVPVRPERLSGDSSRCILPIELQKKLTLQEGLEFDLSVKVPEWIHTLIVALRSISRERSEGCDSLKS
jgi:hypothetical protein